MRRFEALYQIPAKERKNVMAEHRVVEKRVAELFGKIFITSVYRRLKEFSIRAARSARHGNLSILYLMCRSIFHGFMSCRLVLVCLLCC